MLAGDLRDTIDIYVVSEASTTYGNKKKSYSYSFTERAKGFFQSANESLQAQIQHANKTMKFRLRWRHNRYNETQLIKFNEDYYNIIGIDEDRCHEFIVLTAERIPLGTVNIIST